jgi:hypothetical protein
MSEVVFKRKTVMIEDEEEEAKKKAIQQSTPQKPQTKPETTQKTNNSSSKKPNVPTTSAPNKASNGKDHPKQSKPIEKKNPSPIKAVNKPNDKMLAKKRKPSESSSSGTDEDQEYSDSGEDESSSSGSESESSESRERSKKSKPKVKSSKPNNHKSSNKENRTPKEKKPLVLKTKESLIHQFLKRWWYAYDWPGKDDFSEELKANKLRKVEVQDWKIEREVDDKGFSKCIELCGYKGVFRDYTGAIHDFRPKDMCPSLNNFLKKDEKTIYDLLIKALKEQIKSLESGEKYSIGDDKVLKELKEELNLTLDNYKKKFG